MNLVDVREPAPQAGIEPLRWRLLTTHPVTDAEQAWRIVEWYKRRWLIEQFFRVLKTQGFKLEDSQIATAERLLKLVAIAAKATVITIQLLQARDGRDHQPVRLVFDANEVATLAALNHNIEAQSKRLKIRIRPTASLGPPGSSAASAAGTAIHRPNHQAHHHQARSRILLCRRHRMEPQKCVHALEAAKAIGLRFGSIDVVQVDGALKILEINSGVMMEALSRQHPDLVYAAYSAALDKVFGSSSRP